jgi:hypothetical protein
LQEDQMEGFRTHLSVHLGRRPEEPEDVLLRSFYRKLLHSVRNISLRQGTWKLCEQAGWPDNQSSRNIVSWCWETDGQRYLVAINLSDWASDSRIRMPWSDIRGQTLRFDDFLSAKRYEPRDGSEIVDQGMYVKLEPWEFNFLSVAKAA